MLPKVMSDKVDESVSDKIVAKEINKPKCECGNSNTGSLFAVLMKGENEFKIMCNSCLNIKSNKIVCVETVTVYEKRKKVGFYDSWKVIKSE